MDHLKSVPCVVDLEKFYCSNNNNNNNNNNSNNNICLQGQLCNKTNIVPIVFGGVFVVANGQSNETKPSL